jgi:dTDP-L-rhamnose 4-epimerase
MEAAVPNNGKKRYNFHTMNVLVTGGAGFIGTHLSRGLIALGHTVTILDNFAPQIHAGKSELAPDLRPHLRLLIGDVADPSIMRVALENAECIIHLAAETGTGQSMYEVSRYERTNLAGTALIYDLLTKLPAHKVQKIIVASSRAIYGEGAYQCEQHGLVYPSPRTSIEKKAGLFDLVCPVCGIPCAMVPTPETAPLQPSSFYGLTKQVQEQTVLMFGKVLAIPSYALRYQNVYGPGQSLHNPYTGILAIFSNLARTGQLIQIFEDGQESRDFVYIEDVVNATAACLNPELRGYETINVGANERITVLEVANAINTFFGNKSEIKITGAFREGDIRHGMADLTKARALQSYAPRWSFQPGLRKFLEWAAKNALPEDFYERSLTEMKQRGLLRA